MKIVCLFCVMLFLKIIIMYVWVCILIYFNWLLIKWIKSICKKKKKKDVGFIYFCNDSYLYIYEVYIKEFFIVWILY